MRVLSPAACASLLAMVLTTPALAESYEAAGPEAVAVAVPPAALSMPEAAERQLAGEARAAEAAPGPVKKTVRFAPKDRQPDVLVGTPAWSAMKFSGDAVSAADHGAPMVVFVPEGPVTSRR